MASITERVDQMNAERVHQWRAERERQQAEIKDKLEESQRLMGTLGVVGMLEEVNRDFFSNRGGVVVDGRRFEWSDERYVGAQHSGGETTEWVRCHMVGTVAQLSLGRGFIPGFGYKYRVPKSVSVGTGEEGVYLKSNLGSWAGNGERHPFVVWQERVLVGDNLDACLNPFAVETYSGHGIGYVVWWRKVEEVERSREELMGVLAQEVHKGSSW